MGYFKYRKEESKNLAKITQIKEEFLDLDHHGQENQVEERKNLDDHSTGKETDNYERNQLLKLRDR